MLFKNILLICIFQCNTVEATTMEKILGINAREFLRLPKHEFFLKTNNKFTQVHGLKPKSWKTENSNRYPQNSTTKKPSEHISLHFLKAGNIKSVYKSNRSDIL